MLLAQIWFGLLAFILFLAVALDGADLGVGILSLFCRDEARRSVLIGSIGPVWHANLTWLVVLGGVLFAAFPLAYGLILSSLYIPILAMLFGLIFRGVSIEFREQARRKMFWNFSFGAGSLLATLAQGFALGGYLNGLPVQGDHFAGSVFDWLHPFAALIALGLTCGYMLLGAAYLVFKTEGELQEASRGQARKAAWWLAMLAVGIGLWGGLMDPFLSRRWFSWPGLWVTSFPMVLAAATFVALQVSLRRRRDFLPLILSAVCLALMYLAMAASIFPYIVPPGISVDQAAAGPLTLIMMLIVVGVILLPVMIAYNLYQYAVFRGKVGEGGYGG